MVIVLRAGLVVIAVVTVVITNLEFLVPKSVECRNSVSWKKNAPHGAIWEKETILFEKAPADYTMLVGWINATTTIPCEDTSATRPEITIRKLSIISISESGEQQVVETIDPMDGDRFVGRLFPRIPKWFGETEGRNDSAVAVTTGEGLNLLVSAIPLRVYHGWTEPRIVFDPTLRYGIEIEARISETARLQVGLDYWRDRESDYKGWDATCRSSNNCEAFISDWFGNTGGEFRTFIAPTFASFPGSGVSVETVEK